MSELADYIANHRSVIGYVLLCAVCAGAVLFAIFCWIKGAVCTVTGRLILDQYRASVVEESGGIIRHNYLNACKCGYLEKGNNIRSWFYDNGVMRCPHCGATTGSSFGVSPFDTWNTANPIDEEASLALKRMSFLRKLKYMWDVILRNNNTKSWTRHIFVRKDDVGAITYTRVFWIPGFDDVISYIRKNVGSVSR